MRKILIVTGNAGKAREFSSLLGPGWRVRTLNDLPEIPVIEECGATFEENARIKVRSVQPEGGELVMADDSGLEVDALGGAPGVRSARYAGRQGDDAANNRKLLEALAGLPQEQRGAQFRCVLALRLEDGTVRCFEGICRGRITIEPRGKGGFGYDPLFMPEGMERTMAELGAEEKNRLSHRGRAWRAALDYLANGS